MTQEMSATQATYGAQLSAIGTRSSPARRPNRMANERRGGLRLASHFVWLIGLLLATCGLLLANTLLVSVAGVFLPLGFFLSDASRVRAGGVTAMTVYSASAVVTSFANTAALLAANTPRRSQYYLYISEPHIYLAICLALAAAVLPPFVFSLVNGSRTARALQDLLPKLRGEIADAQLVGSGTALGLLAVVFHWQYPSAPLGTLNEIVFLAPLFVVFVLARAGTERNVKWALPSALIVATTEAVRAMLFGYLRGDVAASYVAFVLGALTGARSLRPLKSKTFLPVYAAIAVFIAYFGAYGAVRSKSGAGLDRLLAAQEARQHSQDGPPQHDQTVLSRLTTINQLSQIGRVVDTEGYLHGQTLGYLAYAFVPRFLWPNKPAIAKGAWFALHIGLAYIRPNGQISNAINMTIPGELYLNYGWIGVFVGLTLLGMFISALWRTTRFWSSRRNVLGTAFAFYLMWPWIGFSLGGDLQILVTLIAVYLLFLCIALVFGSLRRAPALVPTLHSTPAASR